MATKQATARIPRHQPADVEVLPAQSPDVALVQADASGVGSFLANIGKFFVRATDLERRAKEMLVDAKTLQPPTNADDDLRIQNVIKTANAAKKTVEEHWGVCQVIHSLHRKLTARRGVAVQALEDTANIAQRLHNRYVDAERERVRREEQRLRDAEELRQREEQDRRAKALEEQAVVAEASMEGLSSREDVFIDHYHRIHDGAIAAKRAGYLNPGLMAERLLRTPKILAALKAKEDADAARRQADAIRNQPVAVDVEAPAMEVIRNGSIDRTTWSGEVLDETAFVHAAMSGKYGIPLDCLQVNQTKLNEFARSLHERLDLWPGVRAKKTTRTV